MVPSIRATSKTLRIVVVLSRKERTDLRPYPKGDNPTLDGGCNCIRRALGPIRKDAPTHRNADPPANPRFHRRLADPGRQARDRPRVRSAGAGEDRAQG